jgi:lipopolysaccharide assembly outer membrane protein LptD (OstA)
MNYLLRTSTILLLASAVSWPQSALAESAPVTISGSQINVFEEGQIVWNLKVSEIKIKENPDLIFLPAISEGTFFNYQTKQPVIKNIQAENAQIHSKTAQLEAKKIKGQLLTSNNKTIEFSGRNYLYNLKESQSHFQEILFNFDNLKVHTKEVNFNHLQNQIFCPGKISLESKGFSLEAKGLKIELNEKKAFFQENLKITANHSFALTGSGGQLDLDTRKLSITSGADQLLKATYTPQNQKKIKITASGVELDFAGETVTFAPQVRLESSKASFTAQQLVFEKKEQKFKLSGNVIIEKNRDEFLKSSEVHWFPEKNILELKGQIKSKFKLDKTSSAAETFF